MSEMRLQRALARAGIASRRAAEELIRAGKVQPDPSSHTGSGEIVVFFSPKGGVGTTTLAVNTAVLLAGGSGTRFWRVVIQKMRGHGRWSDRVRRYARAGVAPCPCRGQRGERWP